MVNMRQRLYSFMVLVWVLLILLPTFWIFISEIKRCQSYNVQFSEKLSTETNDVFEVDFVITWVDSSDTQWQLERAEWSQRVFGSSSIKTNRYPDPDNSSAELKVAVDSVLRYLPWIRKVVIVSQRHHIPNFLSISDDAYEKVRMVHHDEFFKDQSHLPVFNSHAIEANIHHIEDLSENFIYSNDDVYIVRHMLLADFFDLRGRPIVGGTWVPNWVLFNFFVNVFDVNNGVYRAWSNVLEGVGVPYLVSPTHTCVPMTKTLMYSTEKGYQNSFDSTSSAKFRHQLKKQIPAFGLALNHGIISRNVVRHTDSTLQVTMNNLSDKLSSVCLNESFNIDNLNRLSLDFLSPSPQRYIDVGGTIVMLIAHCDDDMLFGAPYLLLSTNEIIIMVLTKQSSNRLRELQSVVAKICMDGGKIQILPVESRLMTDSYSSKARPVILTSMAKCIQNQLRSVPVTLVVSHGAKGEYGHRNHKAVYVVATEIARSLSVQLQTFEEIWKNTIYALSSVEEANFRRQRNRLLRTYESQNYQRYQNWMDSHCRKMN